MPRSTRVFRSLGVLGGAASVQRVRILPPAAASTRLPIRTLAAGTALSFQYDNTFSSAQINQLNGFIRANYPLLTAIFGDPAPEQNSGKTIFVRGDGPAAAYQPLLRPSATDGGTIFFRYDAGVNAQINNFNFTRLVLRAFQGPNTFSYNYAAGDYVESWQGGFADAAALLVAHSAAGSPANFDPSTLGAYVLPIYDLLNRPELGNAYIYPRDPSVDLVMSDFRAAMAQSAWLKVAVENPQFFARFNAAYYAQVPARTAVSPSQLRQIAASVAPNVEGTSFSDWARRQFVLDTSVATGQKLYAAVVPLPLQAGTGQQAGFSGFAEAFTTDSSGDEDPSSGFGRVDAFDEKGVNINARSGELSGQVRDPSKAIQLPGLDFTDSSLPGQADFGAGFSGLGSPDRARITLKFRFKGAETTAYFPYIGGNGSASDINYYGVVTGGDSGSLSISSSNGVNETASVGRGAWSGAARYQSGPRVVTTLKIGASTFVRNTAWLSAGAAARGVGFVLDGGTSEGTFTLKTGSGASKIRMISLPLFPTQSDEAQILGVEAAALKLARFRPNLAPGTLQNGVLTFGIAGDRHELYPQISAPMAPGRGYWLGVDGDFQREVRGAEPSQAVPFEMPLAGGWNQIGVPFNRAFAPDALQVRFGGFGPVSLATAQSNGWVAPGIWGWLPRGGYTRIDDGSGAKLEPGQGYFLFIPPQNGVSLRFDAASSSAPAPKMTGWTVPLSASTNTARDSSNRFGASTRLAAAKPPAAAPVVTLRFLSSGSVQSDASGAGAASGWADSFLPQFEREGEWDFVVEGTKKGERVTLSWGDLKSVPKEVKIVLRDLKTGRAQTLTAGGPSKWTSDGAPRAFSLRAVRQARAQVKVEAAPSRAVSIAVSLDIQASGRLEIQNRDGDLVATLRNGEWAAGTQKLVWNGAGRNGKAAPAGRYRAVWVPLLDGDRSAAASFDR